MDIKSPQSSSSAVAVAGESPIADEPDDEDAEVGGGKIDPNTVDPG